MTEQTSFDINAAVAEWRAVYRQRLELERLAKQLKDGPEAESKASILMYLDTQGLEGAKVEGGTIGRRSSTHVEIADTEQLCRFMFQRMIEALQQGKPLSDCLFLQKTAHKGEVTSFIKNALGVAKDAKVSDEDFNTVAVQLGVKAVSKEDISFRTT